MKYKHAVMGGTFDRLHKGHLSNLKTAFDLGEKVTIGLTTEELHKKKVFHHTIQSIEDRKEQLLSYINKTWPDVPVEIAPIEDIYGPSIKVPEFDALVVTKETHGNGLKINEIRKKNGLKELELVTAPWLTAADEGMLSSTRIRLGEIDREGFVYESLFEKTLHLPDSLRDEFKKAPGQVVPDEHETIRLLKEMKPPLVIAVGDIVSQSLDDAGFVPNIKVIDHKTRRHTIKNDVLKFDVKNAPGSINNEAAAHIFATVRSFLENARPRTVAIDGEEDLLAPPAILSAPLNSVVLHGQIDEGIVITPVTEEKKEYIKNLISKFSS